MERHLALPSSFSLHCVKVHLYCFILVLRIGLQILLAVGKRKLIDINQHLPVRRAVLWGHGYRGLRARENDSMLDFAQRL